MTDRGPRCNRCSIQSKGTSASHPSRNRRPLPHGERRRVRHRAGTHSRPDQPASGHKRRGFVVHCGLDLRRRLDDNRWTGRFPGKSLLTLQLLRRKQSADSGVEVVVSPFGVVGWDGTIWPFAFPILAFQPKTGLVHLPPTIHATFAARGALVCSFVPRVTDFHPEAIPCPYPHSSVDCDELIYYVRTIDSPRPERVKWRVPSFMNWDALRFMLKGAKIADIAIIVNSIDPCISCTER